MNIKPVLGTMNFGLQVDLAETVRMSETFQSMGYNEFDTAYVYNDGYSEKYMGKALKDIDEHKYILATKVNPRITGKLDLDSISDQLMKSLKRLNTKCVDILYLHFPDPSTPIYETLEACSKIYKKGYFKELGLSNYSAHEVINICSICHNNGWPKPTVYQGLYNVLSRDIEKELVPVIRETGIRFYAYNPLAGGILSGKYSSIDSVTPGRFTLRPNYKDRYWKEEFFNAVKILEKICHENNISLIEASFRWLIHHSVLNNKYDDGIIIGSSNIDHLLQNLSYFSSKPLQEDVSITFDEIWNEVKDVSPRYFRTP
tara:strand:+ start:979 stop:1923 length:945 start_codon:yes stop_codon:yes gene_type:complete